MLQIHISPQSEAVAVPCANSGQLVRPDQAVWYNLGISHFHKEKGVSYIQVHTSPYCVDDAHAVEFAHKRADSHRDLPHGVYDAATLNPKNEHPEALVRQNAEYSPLGRGWASLPKIDALTGEQLGDDIYVPHVDRWSNQQPNDGVQGSYHQITGELGTATLEGCIRLIHVLIDEVLKPQAAVVQQP
jgi:hypothetical protein